MTTPKIQALDITQQWSPTSWKATGYVDGVGWLEAWGTSLVDAMEALQALAAQRVAEQARLERIGTEDIGTVAAEASRWWRSMRRGENNNPCLHKTG
jgi:hypothetical protein